MLRRLHTRALTGLMILGFALLIVSCQDSSQHTDLLAFEPVARVFCSQPAPARAEFTLDDLRYSKDGTVSVLTCTINFEESLGVTEMADRLRALFAEDEAAAQEHLEVLSAFLREIMIECGRREQHMMFDGALIARLTLNAVALEAGLLSEDDATRVAQQLKQLSVGDPKLRKRPGMIP